ncbi:MAG TPA: ParB/RepB/Spo0J family partition protein [Nocardioidaceae bacterium]|nr:ParB/RepB/Spo0J family partition protein [Nocardioidaceae bacterium]
MTQHRPGQRRGLGRGLGSLIPTAPPPHPTGADDSSSVSSETAGATASGSTWNNASTATSPAGATAPATDGPVEDNVRADGRVVPDGLAPVEGAYFAEIPVEAISPNPRQPRQVFEEEALAELVHSVKEVGLLQPVVVRRTSEDRYELIMGERRWRATQEAGLGKIPAIVRETSDDAMLRDALLENLHRSQLNPLEEAAAYQQLLDDFGCTHEELAGRIGRSRPQISNTLRLLKLSPAVQRRVAAGVLSAGHARALLAVANPETQDRLAGRVVSEGISVRGLEEIVAVGDLGSDEKPRPRARKPHAPGLDDLAGRLSDRLETRVKVALGKTKGKITVEFASIPDLERIVDLLDPKNDRPV